MSTEPKVITEAREAAITRLLSSLDNGDRESHYFESGFVYALSFAEPELLFDEGLYAKFGPREYSVKSTGFYLREWYRQDERQTFFHTSDYSELGDNGIDMANTHNKVAWYNELN